MPRWETTMQDVRYAWRGLAALPAFTVVIVLSLALGIGANTAAYTLLHAALLRALPISQASQLVEFTTYDATGDGTDHFSYPLYTSYREALRAHADVAAVFPQRLKRIGVDDGNGNGDMSVVERAVVEGASANYFSMLGVTPNEGRLFVEGDDSATGGEKIAVISHSYYERRFGGDRTSAAGHAPAPARASVEGRRLIVDDVPYIVVGVAAKGFDGVEAQAKTDIWIPVTAALPPKWMTNYGSKVLRIIARMRPDADLAQTAAMSDLIYRRYIVDRVLPGMPGSARTALEGRHVRLRPAASGLATIGREYRRPLFVLMGSVDHRAASVLRERRQSAARASARARTGIRGAAVARRRTWTPGASVDDRKSRARIARRGTGARARGLGHSSADPPSAGFEHSARARSHAGRAHLRVHRHRVAALRAGGRPRAGMARGTHRCRSDADAQHAHRHEAESEPLARRRAARRIAHPDRRRAADGSHAAESAWRGSGISTASGDDVRTVHAEHAFGDVTRDGLSAARRSARRRFRASRASLTAANPSTPTAGGPVRRRCPISLGRSPIGRSRCSKSDRDSSKRRGSCVRADACSMTTIIERRPSRTRREPPRAHQRHRAHRAPPRRFRLLRGGSSSTRRWRVISLADALPLASASPWMRPGSANTK